jgi:hypothetical protein
LARGEASRASETAIIPERSLAAHQAWAEYYEEGRYKQALKYSLCALADVPNCPLALWDYAGSLVMLDQTDAALKVFICFWSVVAYNRLHLVTAVKDSRGRVD